MVGETSQLHSNPSTTVSNLYAPIYSSTKPALTSLKHSPPRFCRQRKHPCPTAHLIRVRDLLCIMILGCLMASAQTPDASTQPAGPLPLQLSGADRLRWFVQSTAGTASLAGGVVSSAFGTAFNLPMEYGLHWDGFGKRYGMRLTAISTSNAMEAGLGALWEEFWPSIRSRLRKHGCHI